jgi:phosphoglycolate phosphatase-like HAD superfamily hydrolase
MTTRPDAVIFDVDGTLCDVAALRPALRATGDMHRFHMDSVDCPPVALTAGLWHAIRPDVCRIVVTSRQARYAWPTWFWLTPNGFRPDDMLMRRWNDNRPDAVVKQELLEIILQRYNVLFAFDDRKDICEVWEAAGIPTLLIPGFEA